MRPRARRCSRRSPRPCLPGARPRPYECLHGPSARAAGPRRRSRCRSESHAPGRRILQEAIAGGVDSRPPKRRSSRRTAAWCCSSRSRQLTVTEARGQPRWIHEVGEQHRRQNPIRLRRLALAGRNSRISAIVRSGSNHGRWSAPGIQRTLRQESCAPAIVRSRRCRPVAGRMDDQRWNRIDGMTSRTSMSNAILAKASQRCRRGRVALDPSAPGSRRHAISPTLGAM